MFTPYKSTDKHCSFSCHNIGQKKKNQERQQQYSGINDKGVNSEKELFREIWYSRPRVSFLSGKPLKYEEDGQFWVNLFAHVLAKGKSKYPRFKLYSKNIILLTPEEHMLLDQGTEMNRMAYAKKNGCDWQKVYGLREELIKEYEKSPHF